MRRGFLLTTDTIIAISTMLIVLAIISNQIFQPAAPRSAYLKQISLDVLKVLDYGGRIDAALAGNTSAAREVLEILPVHVCMQLSIESAGNSTVTIARPGCGGFGNELQTAYRTTTMGSARYIVRLESWYDNR